MSLRKVLLSGISDFWTRYFADTDIIEALHEGTLEMVAGAYKELVGTVLTQSFDTVPLTETVPWEPLFIFESDVYECVSSVPGETRYLVQLPFDIRDLSLIHNKVLDPTAALEVGFDFDIIRDDPRRFEELRLSSPFVPEEGYFLALKDDPFRDYSENESNLYRRFATRTFMGEYNVRLTDTTVDFSVNGLGVAVGDVVLAESFDGVRTLHKVESISTNYLEVSSRTPFIRVGDLASYSVGSFSDRPSYDNKLSATVAGQPRTTGTVTSRSKESRVLSAWAPDPQKDFYSLYYMYGHSVSLSETPSTEEYRSFVKGIWNLYLRGPSLENIEGALSVVSGIPVVRDEEETIVEVDLRDPLIPKVTTDLNYYEFSKYTKVRSDVILAAPKFNGETRAGLVRIITSGEVVNAGGFIDFLGVEPGNVLVPQDPQESVSSVIWATDTYLLVAASDARPAGYLVKNGGPARSYSVQEADSTPIPGAFFGSGVWLPNTAVPLTLPAYSTLSDAFVVTDHVETPDWWHTTTIPHNLTTLPFLRRAVTSEVFENFIGSDSGLVSVGDIGKIVGKDEELSQCLSLSPAGQGDPAGMFLACAVGDLVRLWVGGELVASTEVVMESGTQLVIQNFSVLSDSFSSDFVQGDPSSKRVLLASEEDPIKTREVDVIRQDKVSNSSLEIVAKFSIYGNNNSAQSVVGDNLYSAYLRYHPGVHHGIAWQVMDRYLKHNTFTVSWDANTQQFERDRAFYLDLILSSRPAGAYPYVEPGSTLVDRMRSPQDDPPAGADPLYGPRNLYRRIVILDHPHQRADFDVNKMSVDEGFPLQITGMENQYLIGERKREYLLVTDKITPVGGVGEANLLGLDFSFNGIPAEEDSIQVEFQATQHLFSGLDSNGVQASTGQDYVVGVDWVSSYREVDTSGNPIDSYSALIKLDNEPGSSEEMSLVAQGWNNQTFKFRVLASNGVDSFYPVFPNGADPVRTNTRVIGGIGTTPGAIIGGQDPIVGFHETHRASWDALGGGDVSTYVPHGFPEALKTKLMLERSPLDGNQAHVSTTQTLPGEATLFQSIDPNDPWYEGTGNQADPIGSLTVVPIVDDTRHMLITDETIELRVILEDQSPVFLTDPVVRASVDVEFIYDVAVFDPNVHSVRDFGILRLGSAVVDSVTITTSNLPGWLTLVDNSDGTALLSGVPPAGGDFSVTLSASDQLANIATQQFTVSVNEKPSFSSIPATLIAVLGQVWTYNVVCSDINGTDSLRVLPGFLPPWLTLTDNGNRTATLQGTPTGNDSLGGWDVALIVSDSAGLRTTQQFTLQVQN
jgi:hypothetical protein